MQLMSRRNFLELSGLCTASVGALDVAAMRAGSPAGAPSSTPRQAGGEHPMRIATEYTLEDEVSVPLVQTTFVNLLRQHSNNALQVSLAHSGQEGLGATLVRKVKDGTVQAAQFSLANLSGSVPIVDVINIPFWCGDDQQFVNLVTSEAWATRVDAQLAAQGFKALFY